MNEDVRAPWPLSLLIDADIQVFLAVFQWASCMLILLCGLLDVCKWYVAFLQHPDWSAAPYVVWFQLIPYAMVSVIVFVVMGLLRKE